MDDDPNNQDHNPSKHPDFQEYIFRIGTFEPLQWREWPAEALTLAKHGWSLEKDSILTCEKCKELFDISKYSKLETIPAEHLMKAHNCSCDFASTYSPDEFFNIPESVIRLRNGVEFRTLNNYVLGEDLPVISPDVFTDLDVETDFLKGLCKEIGVPQTEKGISALVLGLCGWVCTGLRCELLCRYCDEFIRPRRYKTQSKLLTIQQESVDMEKNVTLGSDSSQDVEICAISETENQSSSRETSSSQLPSTPYLHELEDEKSSEDGNEHMDMEEAGVLQALTRKRKHIDQQGNPLIDEVEDCEYYEEGNKREALCTNLEAEELDTNAKKPKIDSGLETHHDTLNKTEVQGPVSSKGIECSQLPITPQLSELEDMKSSEDEGRNQHMNMKEVGALHAEDQSSDCVVDSSDSDDEIRCSKKFDKVTQDSNKLQNSRDCIFEQSVALENQPDIMADAARILDNDNEHVHISFTSTNSDIKKVEMVPDKHDLYSECVTSEKITLLREMCRISDKIKEIILTNFGTLEEARTKGVHYGYLVDIILQCEQGIEESSQEGYGKEHKDVPMGETEELHVDHQNNNCVAVNASELDNKSSSSKKFQISSDHISQKWDAVELKEVREALGILNYILQRLEREDFLNRVSTDADDNIEVELATGKSIKNLQNTDIDGKLENGSCKAFQPESEEILDKKLCQSTGTILNDTLIQTENEGPPPTKGTECIQHSDTPHLTELDDKKSSENENEHMPVEEAGILQSLPRKRKHLNAPDSPHPSEVQNTESSEEASTREQFHTNLDEAEELYTNLKKTKLVTGLETLHHLEIQQKSSVEASKSGNKNMDTGDAEGPSSDCIYVDTSESNDDSNGSKKFYKCVGYFTCQQGVSQEADKEILTNTFRELNGLVQQLDYNEESNVEEEIHHINADETEVHHLIPTDGELQASSELENVQSSLNRIPKESNGNVCYQVLSSELNSNDSDLEVMYNSDSVCSINSDISTSSPSETNTSSEREDTTDDELSYQSSSAGDAHGMSNDEAVSENESNTFAVHMDDEGCLSNRVSEDRRENSTNSSKEIADNSDESSDCIITYVSTNNASTSNYYSTYISNEIPDSSDDSNDCIITYVSTNSANTSDNYKKQNCSPHLFSTQGFIYSDNQERLRPSGSRGKDPSKLHEKYFEPGENSTNESDVAYGELFDTQCLFFNILFKKITKNSDTPRASCSRGKDLSLLGEVEKTHEKYLDEQVDSSSDDNMSKEEPKLAMLGHKLLNPIKKHKFWCAWLTGGLKYHLKQRASASVKLENGIQQLVTKLKNNPEEISPQWKIDIEDVDSMQHSSSQFDTSW